VIIGNVYIVFTTLSRQPKDKITICISTQPDLFFWINTAPHFSGESQLPLSPSDHHALTHDCFLDCRRVTTFLPGELANAKDRGPISKALAGRIIAFLQAFPPKTLPAAQLKLAIRGLSFLP
jgi:hypothetical protein